ALLVDPDGERALTDAFTEYTGQAWDPAGESRRARLDVLSDALHSELARLTEAAGRACGASPACPDYTPAEIQTPLAELPAGSPSDRTSLGDDATCGGVNGPAVPCQPPEGRYGNTGWVDEPRDATCGGVNARALPAQPPADGKISPLSIDRARIAHAARAAL